MISVSEIEALHRKYAPNDTVYDLVYGHCQVVNEIALWCAGNAEGEAVDHEVLRVAALLHDVGTYILFDEQGNVANHRMYPLHAILSAKIIADEGIDTRVARIVETHVLLGLSKQEIIDKPWVLPARDYIPTSIEGRLLCYADRFHSKKPVFNAYQTFLGRLQKELPLQAAKFEEWAQEFGLPDLEALANKYGQQIR